MNEYFDVYARLLRWIFNTRSTFTREAGHTIYGPGTIVVVGDGAHPKRDGRDRHAAPAPAAVPGIFVLAIPVPVFIPVPFVVTDDTDCVGIYMPLNQTVGLEMAASKLRDVGYKNDINLPCLCLFTI